MEVAVRGLPVSNIVGELAHHRVMVAFQRDPEIGRFWAAGPAALVGLKEAAFGRTWFSGESVDRDFSDVASLLDRLGDEIAVEVSVAPVTRARVVRAAERLLGDEAALNAATRELVASGQQPDQPTAEAEQAPEIWWLSHGGLRAGHQQ